MANDNVRNVGRIMYVEPNDAAGVMKSENGGEVSLTSDYSDMCISLRIIVERVDRVNGRNVISVDKDGNSVYDYASDYASDTFGQKNGKKTADYVTFYANGTVMSNDSREFLSTYYTDITAKDFESSEIVEGVGITNVTISYESFYTPTVKIHFVDVRGCSLMGREEYIHDNDGTITQNNLFGSFFTMPYPKFKIQVKGFFGRPVTYQLSCLDFQAQFNSQTGNFEADVTFIGYEFGILSDIPLRYIMAAPYCDYVGREYWNNNVNSKRWGLGKDGDEKPITLSDLARNIRRAMQEKAEPVATQDESLQIDQMNRYKQKLGEAMEQYELLEKESVMCYPVMIGETAPADYVAKMNNRGHFYTGIEYVRPENGNIQPIMLYEQTYLEYSGKVGGYVTEDVYDVLIRNYDFTKNDSYVHIYTNKGEYGYYSLSGIWNEETKKTEYRGNFFGSETNTLYDLKKNYVPHEISVPDEDGMKAIIDIVNDLNPNGIAISSSAELKSTMESEMSKADAEIDRINKSIESRANSEKIDPMSVFEITPYIGNVFKLVLCHLETFMHMMHNCVERIENGRGGADKSDSANKRCISSSSEYPNPFVNVVLEKDITDNENGEKNGDGNRNGSDNTDTTMVIGWPGNLSNSSYFEEVKLVNELCLAAKRENMANSGQMPEVSYDKGFYILPSDLANQNFTEMSRSTSKDKLSCWFANRCASLFGVCFPGATDAEASAIGRVDAMKYFAADPKMSKSLLSEADDETYFPFADAVMKISECTTDLEYGKYSSVTSRNANYNRFSYEIGSNMVGVADENRNPVFERNGDLYEYKYICNANGDGYVLQEIPEDISRNAISGTVYAEVDANTEKCFYKAKHETDGSGFNPNILYKVGTNKFFQHDANDYGIDEDNFCSNVMFGVYDDVSLDSLHKKMVESESFSINGIKVNNSDAVKSVFSKYWKCGKDDFSAFYKPESGKRAMCFYDETAYDNEKPLPDGFDKIDYETADFTGKWYYGDTGTIRFDGTEWISRNDSAENEDGDDKITPKIAEIRLFHRKTNGSGEIVNDYLPMFMSKHYYAQGDNNEAKAYLFAMNLPYSHKEMIFDSENEGYVKSIPYGYALKIGAMLWRKRQEEDPIAFVDGTKRGDCGKDSTMLDGIIGDADNYRFIAYSNIDSFDAVDFDKIVDDGIDRVVENKLIRVFKDFAAGKEFESIRSNLEVRCTENNHNSIITPDQIDGINTLISEKWQNDKKAVLNRLYLTTNMFNLYDNIHVSNNKEIRGLRIRNGNAASNIIVSLFSRKIVIAKASSVKNGSDGKISVRDSVYRSYLTGFSNALSEMVESKKDNVSEGNEDSGSETDNANKLNVYLLLKNLYDRWLMNLKLDQYSCFDVENYFENFVFIDTFYRNITYRLHVNVDTLLPAIVGNSREAMLMKLFADIASKHNCMFFGMPDYTSFHVQDGSGNKRESAIACMNDIFTPVPYSAIDSVAPSNKFVVMYTHSPSKVCMDGNGFKKDCFDIIREDTLPAILKGNNELPKKLSQSGGKLYDTSGRNVVKVSSLHDIKLYDIPAFGVVFGRQNNSIFKSVSVGMSNPTVTAQSLQALANIAEQGQSGTRVRFTYGQDLYTVYSGYSYTCEVEMMGCAQITPLMYFQLTNIPMFNGTYMIFSVEHQMVPGNMTTRFKGIKICRYAFPFTHDWFSKDNPWGNGAIYSSKDDEFDGCETDVSTVHLDCCEDFSEKN